MNLKMQFDRVTSNICHTMTGTMAAAVLACAATSWAAPPSGGPPGEGRNSSGHEVQQGAKPDRAPQPSPGQHGGTPSPRPMPPAPDSGKPPHGDDGSVSDADLNTVPLGRTLADLEEHLARLESRLQRLERSDRAGAADGSTSIAGGTQDQPLGERPAAYEQSATNRPPRRTDPGERPAQQIHADQPANFPQGAPPHHDSEARNGSDDPYNNPKTAPPWLEHQDPAAYPTFQQVGQPQPEQPKGDYPPGAAPPQQGKGHQGQPPVDEGKAAHPEIGRGQQQGKTGAAVAARAGGSHLHLVLQVTDEGDSEVIRSVEVPGEAPTTDAPVGNYIYEVSRGGQTVAVQAIPDPFEAHDFGGPPGSKPHHTVHRLSSAEISVDVPNSTMAALNVAPAADAGLSFKLYRIDPATRLQLEKIDKKVLDQLKAENKAQVKVEASAAKFTPQIQEKAVQMQDNR